MTIFDALAGGSAEMDRYRGPAVPAVNVASPCGMTSQYAGAESLYDTPDGAAQSSR
jgi:glutathione peroxidase